jgi:hypothetical protein
VVNSLAIKNSLVLCFHKKARHFGRAYCVARKTAYS